MTRQPKIGQAPGAPLRCRADECGHEFAEHPHAYCPKCGSVDLQRTATIIQADLKEAVCLDWGELIVASAGRIGAKLGRQQFETTMALLFGEHRMSAAEKKARRVGDTARVEAIREHRRARLDG